MIGVAARDLITWSSVFGSICFNPLEEVLEIQATLSSEQYCCAFQSLYFGKLVHRQINGYVVDLLGSARVRQATPNSTTNVAEINRTGVTTQGGPFRRSER